MLESLYQYKTGLELAAQKLGPDASPSESQLAQKAQKLTHKLAESIEDVQV